MFGYRVEFVFKGGRSFMSFYVLGYSWKVGLLGGCRVFVEYFAMVFFRF